VKGKGTNAFVERGEEPSVRHYPGFQARSRPARRSFPSFRRESDVGSNNTGAKSGVLARPDTVVLNCLLTRFNRSKIQKSFWTEFETVCELLGMTDRNLAFVLQDASRNRVINFKDFAQLAGRNLVLFN
jgi:hypothetical protein